MSMTIACILLLAALVIAILHMIGRAPLSVAVLLTIVAGLLHCLPIR